MGRPFATVQPGFQGERAGWTVVYLQPQVFMVQEQPVEVHQLTVQSAGLDFGFQLQLEGLATECLQWNPDESSLEPALPARMADCSAMVCNAQCAPVVRTDGISEDN